jgi:hypothetical protein
MKEHNVWCVEVVSKEFSNEAMYFVNADDAYEALKLGVAISEKDRGENKSFNKKEPIGITSVSYWGTVWF